jgi:acyl carrier protein
MNQATFLKRLAEALDFSGELDPAQDLDSVDGWDSLGILSTIDLLSELGVEVSGEILGRAKLVAELIAVAGEAIDDA